VNPICKTAVSALLASLSVAACSPQEDVHLTCATTIFVADKLMETGKVPTEPALRQKANDAEINHQNASATFRRLDTREPEGERERLMELAFILGTNVIEFSRSYHQRKLSPGRGPVSNKHLRKGEGFRGLMAAFDRTATAARRSRFHDWSGPGVSAITISACDP
jgi:hypothetical protein